MAVRVDKESRDSIVRRASTAVDAKLVRRLAEPVLAAHVAKEPRESNARHEVEWQQHEKSGKGMERWDDGSAYEGAVPALGWAVGQVRFTWANGNVFNCEERGGCPQGFGKFVHVDGSVHEDEWQEGEKSDKGMERWGVGSAYEGEFLHGKKHGVGVFRSDAGTISLEGQFRHDKADGEGPYTCANGNPYVGLRQGGHLHGLGTMRFRGRVCSSAWQCRYQ